MNIKFRKFIDMDQEYLMIYNWCRHKFVYEWFEQRILTLDEIKNKYKNKLGKQELLIIECDDRDIGLVQIYKYDDKIDILNNYHDIYEYDLFIGEEDYLSKGIGTKIVKLIDEYIYSKYKANYIVLRPFKRNIRAINCYKKCGYKELCVYYGEDTLGNFEEIMLLIKEKY